MAEETNVNGVVADLEADPTVQLKEDTSEKIKLLMDEIEGLKTGRAEMKKRLDERLEENRKVVEEAEVDKRALLEITTRAVELETDVSRLQHELLENDEVSKELREKVAEIQRIQKEKEELVERVGRLEGEKVELEKKVLGFERVRASEVKAAKDVQDEKEEVILSLKEVMKKLEAKVRELEMELNEKRSVNGGIERGIENVTEEEDGAGAKGLKIQWPALALASTGSAAAAAAAVYIGYARRR